MLPKLKFGIWIVLLLYLIIIPSTSLFLLWHSFPHETYQRALKIEFFSKPDILLDILEDNPASGTAFHDLHGHTTAVNSIDFSPDGICIASGDDDGTIKLWDVLTGEPLPLNLTGHTDSVNSVVFSPNGAILASGSRDQAIKLWDVASGKLIRNLEDHTSSVFSVAFSPDGAILASGSADGTIKLWNTTTGAVLRTLTEHGGFVYSVTFSSKGKILASGGADGTIKLWNITSEDKLPLPTELNDDADISRDRGLVFSPDGAILASGSADGIKLWNATTGAVLRTLTEHRGNVFSVSFSSNGKIMASGSSDDTIKLWNTSTGDELLLNMTKHTEDVNSVDFSPDGTTLASGSDDSTIKLWNVVFEDEIPALRENDEDVLSIAFSPNGTILASGSADDSIRLWDVANENVSHYLTGHTDDVFSVAFSPNGTILASGSADNTIKLWNVVTGQMIQNLTGHNEDVFSVTFSPNSTILASGCADGTIKLWNIDTGTEIKEIREYVKVESVAFSPNGTFLAAGSGAENIIKLWNIYTGEPLPLNLIGHKNWVKTVAFSPNSTILASGDVEGIIRFWNINTGSNVPLSPKHVGGVSSVAFSSDGTILASGGEDGRIRLWNVTTTKEIQSLPGNSGAIKSVTFSPDDGILASGGVGGIIKLWAVSPIQFDFDVDSMLDSWERRYDLDSDDFWDKFADNDADGLMNSLEFFLNTHPLNRDSDSDGMLDGWEYLGGLDPNVNDAHNDSDGDEMINLYEYQMGLNPRLNDAAADKDNDSLTNIQEFLFGSWANQSDSDMDGMPDWWEFKYSNNAYSFTPRNGSDTKDDPDGDWVSNLDEFKGGSNPRDFWNVPLIALSAFLIIRIMILLIIVALAVVVVLTHRKTTRNALISRFNAPDYLTALKIEASEYTDYAAFVQARKDTEKLLDLGNSAFFQGNFPEAFDHYDQALTISERLDNKRLIAETVFKVAWLQKEDQTLTTESAILSQFPTPPYETPIIEAFDQMIQALVAETEKNWPDAEKAWKKALRTEGISIEYQLLCQGALVQSDFRNWLINPLDSIKERVLSQLTEWLKASEHQQFFDRMCEAYLLHARIALASYQFDQVEEWLKLCSTTAETAGLNIFLNKVESESEAFLQHKQRLFQLLEEEKALSPEDQMKILHSYVREALEIAKTSRDNES